MKEYVLWQQRNQEIPISSTLRHSNPQKCCLLKAWALGGKQKIKREANSTRKKKLSDKQHPSTNICNPNRVPLRTPDLGLNTDQQWKNKHNTMPCAAWPSLRSPLTAYQQGGTCCPMTPDWDQCYCLRQSFNMSVPLHLVYIDQRVTSRIPKKHIQSSTKALY